MWCFARFGTICTMKNTQGGVLLLVTLQTEAYNSAKSPAPSWVFHTFQIVQMVPNYAKRLSCFSAHFLIRYLAVPKLNFGLKGGTALLTLCLSIITLYLIWPGDHLDHPYEAKSQSLVERNSRNRTKNLPIVSEQQSYCATIPTYPFATLF